MTGGSLAFVEPDERVFRIARRPDPWAWPDWAYAGPDGTFGNRYDDPFASYRVLYASSQRLGAFVETLARFRPDLEVLAELDAIEGEDEPRSNVPRRWLRSRTIGTASLRGRFVDVGDARTLAALRDPLAAAALHLGLDEVDAATVRLRAPRAFTQALSRHVYAHVGGDGPFAGVRYGSRLGDQFVNWAVFEPPPGARGPLVSRSARRIWANDPDLRAALDLLGLALD